MGAARAGLAARAARARAPPGCGAALAEEGAEARASRLQRGSAYFDLVGFALDQDGARAAYPLPRGAASLKKDVRWTPAKGANSISDDDESEAPPPRFRTLFPPSVTPADVEALFDQMRGLLGATLEELDFPRDLIKAMIAEVRPLRALWAAEFADKESPRPPRPSLDEKVASAPKATPPSPAGAGKKKKKNVTPAKKDSPATVEEEPLPVSDGPKPYGELGCDPNPFGHGLDRCNIALAVVLMFLAVAFVWYLP